MVDLPAWWYRPIGFVVAASAHSWAVERMRAKLASDPGFIETEGDRMILRDFGDAPSPDPDARMSDEDERQEVQMREQAREDYCNMLRRAESDMWGLGIAGLFHQWERSTKHFIATFSAEPLAKLEHKDFNGLCGLLERLGFDIKQCNAFAGLETARMISNTVKHGEGPEFRTLIARHPELAAGFEPSRWSKDPRPDDLRFTIRDFDAAAAAIGELWVAFENARSQSVLARGRCGHTGTRPDGR